MAPKKGLSYDYLDDFDRFEEKELPSKTEFCSKLANENISDSAY